MELLEEQASHTRRYGKLEAQLRASELFVLSRDHERQFLVVAPWFDGEEAAPESIAPLGVQEGEPVMCALYEVPPEQLTLLHEAPQDLRDQYRSVKTFPSQPTAQDMETFLQSVTKATLTCVCGDIWLTADEGAAVQEARAAVRAEADAFRTEIKDQLSQLFTAVQGMGGVATAGGRLQGGLSGGVLRRGGALLGGGRGLSPPDQNALADLARLQAEARQGLGVRAANPLASAIGPRGAQPKATTAPRGLLFGAPTANPYGRETDKRDDIIGKPAIDSSTFEDALRTFVHTLEDQVTGTGGSRGAAALSKHRSTFIEHPMAEYELVATRAAEELGSPEGMSDAALMKTYFERRVAVTSRSVTQIFTMLNLIHSALAENDVALALGRIAASYQTLEEWAHEGHPHSSMSRVAWAAMRAPDVHFSAWTAQKYERHANATRPLSNPKTSAMMAQVLRDEKTLHGLREEEAALLAKQTRK